MFAYSDLDHILCWLCPDKIQLWWEPAEPAVTQGNLWGWLRVAPAASCATGTSWSSSCLNCKLCDRFGSSVCALALGLLILAASNTEVELLI